mgnify:CR=1 FL=1
MENKKYCWDLECLLKGKTLDALIKEWTNKQEEILKLYPDFYKSLPDFKKWLKVNEEDEVISNRLMNYISNNYQEDLSNPKWISYSQKISTLANEYGQKTSDYQNIILKNEKKIRSYLKDKSISEYQRAFDLIFKTKKHILSKKEEKLLTKVSRINSGFERIFDTLTDSDIKFDDAIDSKGKKIPLKTVADVSKYLKNKDRQLRKTTWINFNHAFNKFESSLTQTLYYNYLMLNTNSKLRNYKDYIDAAADADEVDEKLILHIYKMIQKFKPSIDNYSKKFNKLLKKQLNLPKLEPWDKSVDLTKKEVKVTIEQTKKIVLEALKPLGKDYLSNIKKAFDENWISWLPKPSKQTGAYSIGGTKGLDKYYISMNFDETFRSISTIAHELGHSMHSLYFNKKQKVYADCGIFYAEISSIVNETLLSLYLIDKYKNDKEMTRMILDEFISNFFSTTTRQIIFSNFEYLANQYVNQAKPFTKESLKKLYIDMIKKYQGVSKEIDKKINTTVPYTYIPSTIFRIGHFYVGNFYVYKYAIGQIVAIDVANKIYNGDKQMLKRYFDFLSSGCSKSPLDTIKILGIDLRSEKPYNESKNFIDEIIKKFN